MVWREEWSEVPATKDSRKSGRVGVYMTHTDESYIPTDGTASKPGNGGILKVGNVLLII